MPIWWTVLPLTVSALTRLVTTAFALMKPRLELTLTVSPVRMPFSPASVSPIRSGGQRLQRVRVGPLDTVERADGVLNAILQAGLTDAKIVVD